MVHLSATRWYGCEKAAEAPDLPFAQEYLPFMLYNATNNHLRVEIVNILTAGADMTPLFVVLRLYELHRSSTHPAGMRQLITRMIVEIVYWHLHGV